MIPALFARKASDADACKFQSMASGFNSTQAGNMDSNISTFWGF
jgi:hypothetical protein